VASKSIKKEVIKCLKNICFKESAVAKTAADYLKKGIKNE